MRKQSAANSEKIPKPRGKPWPKGVSGNATGRPRDGENWSSIIKTVGNMYPTELLTFIGRDNDLGRLIAQLPKNAQMKYLVVARVFASLMFEPTAGLWNGLMDRSDGKVTTPIDVTTDGDKITKVEFDYGKLIGSVAPRPDEDPEAPSEDESGLHGETMGKDNTGGNAGAGSG